VAWALAALALGRGEAEGHAPEATPPGPEARLIAARAAFADDEDGPARVLGRFARGDADLRWFAEAARASNKGAALKLAKRLEERPAERQAAPVSAYVGGALAQRYGRRHLAKTLLEDALEGHADVCRAAAFYAATLSALGESTRSDPRLQAARKRYACARE
jgi:hypothetical protein